MILESHLPDSTLLQIDCESDAGIHKGSGGRTAHPDKVVDTMALVIQQIGRALGERVREAGIEGAEIEFALKVDFSANVIIAQHPSDGQVRVRLKL